MPEISQKEDSRNRFQRLYDEKYRPTSKAPVQKAQNLKVKGAAVTIKETASKPPFLLIPAHNKKSASRPKKHFAPLIRKNQKDPLIEDAMSALTTKKIEALKEFRYF